MLRTKLADPLTQDLYETLQTVLKMLTMRKIGKEDYQEMLGLILRSIAKFEKASGR
jgi:hypothetical protein